MRILKNTFNDYFITKKRIVNENNKHRISNEKLFTLSLYRNIFPSEYAKLEKNEGVLPILLSKKILVETITDKLDEDNKTYEKEIEDIKSESLQKFDELKYMLKGILLGTSYRNGYGGMQINSITTFEGLEFDKLTHPVYTSSRVDMSIQTRGTIDDIKRNQDMWARGKQITLKFLLMDLYSTLGLSADEIIDCINQAAEVEGLEFNSAHEWFTWE